MKFLHLILSILFLCFISCKKEIRTGTKTINRADSVITEESIAEKPLGSTAEMKALTKYATPGNLHKMMADETGTWNCDMTFWTEANGNPEKATYTANIKMILGGRYQETNFQGMMMGQSFEGKSTLAYNNASKEYTTTLIDNIGTGMMVGIGKYDKKTKSIELKGDMVNPLNGKKTSYREIYTIVDPTTRKIEMFDTKNGKEYKYMEIVMKKK